MTRFYMVYSVYIYVIMPMTFKILCVACGAPGCSGTERDPESSRPLYKHAVVSLGLLCTVLLTTLVTICVHCEYTLHGFSRNAHVKTWLFLVIWFPWWVTILRVWLDRILNLDSLILSPVACPYRQDGWNTSLTMTQADCSKTTTPKHKQNCDRTIFSKGQMSFASFRIKITAW